MYGGLSLKLDKNLTDSINYTQILFTDLGRLLLLIILDIIPIVNLIVLGYVSRVIKEHPDSKELPPLENYWDLWVQGLKIVVAAIIYLIIPIILIVPFVFLTVLAWMAFPGLPAVGWVVAIPMLIIGLLLAFFFAIILAMAIVNMVRKDSFGKAFAIGEILSVIGRVGWGTYILWLIVLFVCALIVGGIGSIPAIGWILSLIIGPIFGVFVARSASLTYLEGVSPEEPEAVEAPKETTKKFCAYCGAEMTAEAIYCPKCGKKQ
jgi:ribosomal protein L40E